MSEITLTSELTVKHIQSVGCDLTLCRAAWQSSGEPPASELTEARIAGLLRSLVRNRHGSPLESGFMTVAVHAPLFVLGQWIRHRHTSISIDDLSYSVESTRYRELEPVFWVPRLDRPMVKVPNFRPMRPEFEYVGAEGYADAIADMRAVYLTAWNNYSRLLAGGIASEVARVVLPASVYCHWWASGNVRSWLSFLSLRTKDDRAGVTSHVQRETEETGRAVELLMEERWPLLMRAWNEGRRGAV